ncbi:MAG: ribosomal protein, partial [Thermoleophilia bacterium]|nr:ribosomal protein [Thermoleophilia bacterium]
VVDQIRGKRVLDAATALAFSDRDAAREVMKALKSAVANAENNHGMRADELYVSAAFVDEGPTFKRWKPRARGRVDKIFKRTCHITVIVDNAPAALLEGRAGKRAAAKAGDRSARVAGSKKTADTKSPAKKPTSTKAPKKAKDATPKPTEANETKLENADAANPAATDAAQTAGTEDRS